jgi:isochorismate synthase EntC
MVVAIRCGLKNNNSLHLYGGAGFIKESDIENEYNEINSKISTITNLLKNE